jgi:hypothetical protein
MKLRFLCLSTIIFLLCGVFSAVGMDCEIPPMVDLATTPNVLIIYDCTGSMLTEDIPGYEHRLALAREVLTQLLADPVAEGFRWGLMAIDGSRIKYQTGTGLGLNPTSKGRGESLSVRSARIGPSSLTLSTIW